jgi:CheY-like chemotaxis protein
MPQERAIRVLLVEDNPADTLLAKELILETGLNVLVSTVTDGEKAIDLINKVRRGEVEKPDLVLLDLNLPKRRGDEVLEVIRSEGGTRSLCVAIFTGSHSPEDLRRAGRRANAYLIKPIGPKEMAETVVKLREILTFSFTSDCEPPDDDGPPG